MESSLDISNNLPLTEEQKSSYITRMKAAWARLPDDKKAALKPMLDEANQQYADFVAKKEPPQHRFHNVLRMRELSDERLGGHVKAHQQQVEAAIEIKLGPEGEILGTGKYEQLDPCSGTGCGYGMARKSVVQASASIGGTSTSDCKCSPTKN